MTSVYTYATLAVNKSTYDDVKERLHAADGREVGNLTGTMPLDMHGIALIVEQPVVEKPKKVSKRKPRRLLKSELWAQEVTKGQTAIAEIRAVLGARVEKEMATLTAVFEALQEHKDDYAERYGNMPESLQGGENGERLQAIDEIDLGDYEENPLETFLEALEAFEASLNECENADLPKD